MQDPRAPPEPGRRTALKGEHHPRRLVGRRRRRERLRGGPTRPTRTWSTPASTAATLSRFDRRTGQARDVSIWPYNPSGIHAGRAEVPLPVDRPGDVLAARPKVPLPRRHVLFRTTDGGQTWKKVSGDLTRNDKEQAAVVRGGPRSPATTTGARDFWQPSSPSPSRSRRRASSGPQRRRPLVPRLARRRQDLEER